MSPLQPDKRFVVASICRKVFGGLAVVYPFCFHLPLVLLGAGVFDEHSLIGRNIPAAAFGFLALAAVLALLFAIRLAMVFSGFARWVHIPVAYLLSLVPFFGPIGLVVLYKLAASTVGKPLGEPPARPPMRACRCGGHMMLTCVRQWRKLGTPVGFEAFYTCLKCGIRVVFPSPLWLLRIGGASLAFLLMATGGIFLCWHERGPSVVRLIAIVVGLGLSIWNAFLFVRGARNYWRYRVLNDSHITEVSAEIPGPIPATSLWSDAP